MPFRSEKQRRYLWAKKPDVARKFADDASTPWTHRGSTKGLWRWITGK